MTDAMIELGPKSVERLPSANSISASADITVSDSFKKLPKKRKSLIKRWATKTVLTASAFSLMISSGCGNAENQSPTIYPEPTPISSPTLEKPTEEKLIIKRNVEKMIKDFEFNFKIEITSPDELSEVELARIRKPDPDRDKPVFIVLPFPGLMNKKFPVVEWKEKDLLRLQKILSDLPSHFYSPFPPKTVKVSMTEPRYEREKYYPLLIDWFRYNLNDYSFSISSKEIDAALEKGFLEVDLSNRPVQFILADVSSAHEQTREAVGGICNCHDMISGHQIIFPKHKFENGDAELSRAIVAHELTHRIIHPDKEDFYASFVARILRLTNWDQYSNIIEDKISRAGNNLSEKEKDRLKSTQRTWAEFLPVATEFYINGHEEFLETYTPFVGELEAIELYKFIKDEIFLGKEYK